MNIINENKKLSNDLIHSILERFTVYYHSLKEKTEDNIVYIFNELNSELIEEFTDMFGYPSHNWSEIDIFIILEQCLTITLLNHNDLLHKSNSLPPPITIPNNKQDPLESNENNTKQDPSFDENENRIDLLTAKIKELQNIPQPKQRSKDWYIFRYNLITASNAYKVLGSQAAQNSIIYEKCCPLEIYDDADDNNNDNQKRIVPIKYINTNNPLHWGQKYEPLSVQIYQIIYKTSVAEFGCIKHPKYPFIGASPDGINMDINNKELYGRMLEVKNIVNRPITGTPKHEYMVQMQIQMETCDLDDCDFLETKFYEYLDEKTFETDLIKSIKNGYKKKTLQNEIIDDFYGIIIQFQDINCPAPLYKYYIYNNNTAYCNKCDDVNCLCGPMDQIKNWKNEMLNNTLTSEITWMKTIYWKLDIISRVLIKRDKEWFNENVDKFKTIWDLILDVREAGTYKDFKPVPKKAKETSPVLNDDFKEITITTNQSNHSYRKPTNDKLKCLLID